MYVAEVANTIGVATVALVVGALAALFFERSRRAAANQRREDIIRDAEREAETVRKSAELAAREELLQLRSDLDSEHNQ
ncbi:MAG: Rnase Y domain-containing protein, partial [Planctomycetota bacterium]|nr:Rnase Y domain-containing protein [Planctomycetota bacterium]